MEKRTVEIDRYRTFAEETVIQWLRFRFLYGSVKTIEYMDATITRGFNLPDGMIVKVTVELASETEMFPTHNASSQR